MHAFRLIESVAADSGAVRRFNLELVWAADGSPLFIAVRNRAADALLITRSELGVARNIEDNHVLALVDGDQVRYLRRFDGIPNPAFGTSSISLSWQAYFERGQVPW